MSNLEVVKDMEGASPESHVKLVKIENSLWVWKKEDVKWVKTEKEFYSLLDQHGIVTLDIYVEYPLQDDELLLEYVDGEKTLAVTEDEHLMRKWGKLMSRVHGIQEESCWAFNIEGHKVQRSWGDYMREYADTALKRAEEKAMYDFSDQEVQSLKEVFEEIVSSEPNMFSLIHGDIHSNNVLLKNDTPVLFDKNDDVLYGRKELDLAIILLDYFSGTIANVDDAEHVHDRRMLESFCEGYGAKIWEDVEVLKFLLLVGLRRASSPFGVHNVRVCHGVLRILEGNKT